jgi:hypothetical protein
LAQVELVEQQTQIALLELQAENLMFLQFQDLLLLAEAAAVTLQVMVALAEHLEHINLLEQWLIPLVQQAAQVVRIQVVAMALLAPLALL